MPAWEDRDGDGHKELSGEVAPVATVVGVGAGVTAAGLGTVSGVTAAAAVAATATVAGAPVGAVLGIVSGVTAAAAAAAGGVAAAAGGVAYFADRYDWDYSIEPGSVVEGIQETASNAWEEVQETAGNAWEEMQEARSSLHQKATDYVRDFWDRNNDGFVVPPRDDETGRIFRSGVGQTLGMRRLDEAFARLQSLAR